jgi:exodeoxyribonuclease V alpha subunit
LVAERWKGAFQAKDPAEALLEFSKFRVLCAHREGQFGVQRLNQLITQRLVERHWLSQAGRASRGQLIMILENDSSLALSNGDVGIVWPDADGGLSACFAREAGQLRRLSLSQLPRYELCFALTIHKSQGSEYDEVALILPKPGSRIVTRELLYTGLTRARRAAHVYGDLDTLTDATERRVIRNSGLGQLVRRFARSEQ